MIFRVSVSKLVAFACRSGDLVLQAPQGPTALQGIKAHQKIQREQTAGVESEVALKIPMSIGEDEVVLSGRMDLLDPNVSPPLIQEIKSTLVPPDKIPSSTTSVYWAQLRIYGYCYLLQSRDKDSGDSAQQVQLCLLWYNLQNQVQIPESSLFSFDELETFTHSAIEQYLAWIRKVDRQFRQTCDSAKTMRFPYGEFRHGQRDMAAATYRIARDSGQLLCEAPTGIGKTVSTLFPVVKAIGDKHIKKVVYLTAKTSGREVALKTVRDLQHAGLQTNFLVIQSKTLVCHCSNGTCERDDMGRCPLTLGFFDRLPAARDELLDGAGIDAGLLNAVATKYQLCPFELSLQMLPWITLVICDYNYVFDPLVRLPAFSETDKRLLLLMDESHNLIDRSRNMYSARLTRQQNQAVIKACEHTHPGLVRSLRSLTRALDRWARTNNEQEWAEALPPKTVSKAVARCIEAMSADSAQETPIPEGMFEWFKELFRYAVIEDLFGDHHRTLTRVVKEGGYRDIELRLLCVNAREHLERSFSLFRAAIAFSATLRPLEYYRQGLGLPESTKGMLLESPFDSSRLGVYVCSYIDTRYRQRRQSAAALVAMIYRVFSSRRGNYLVFFPSYAYLQAVLDEFTHAHSDVETVVQLRSSGAEEREFFLQQFNSKNAVLGFAIMGGIYGEGIDYEGDRLIGSIIVGTGLPSLGLEQRLIAEDFTANGLNGFDYAYRYPGFTKVLQTAGRVIRSEKDRGVVVLVDARFTEVFYRALYPEHWSVEVCSSTGRLTDCLEEFWRRSLGEQADSAVASTE